MEIQYKYTIVKVDAQARCMEIVYEAEGHQTMHISTRLPYEGELLENIVKMYAPVALWNELALAVDIPNVGVTGIITPPPPPPPALVLSRPPSNGSTIPQTIL